jgi:hypothetical protein
MKIIFGVDKEGPCFVPQSFFSWFDWYSSWRKHIHTLFVERFLFLFDIALLYLFSSIEVSINQLFHLQLLLVSENFFQIADV